MPLRDEPPVVRDDEIRIGIEGEERRERLDPGSVAAVTHYEHPIYTADAVRAQSRLGGLATDRTVYAGAYHGWGFHEDGCRSGVEAARHFGVTW